MKFLELAKRRASVRQFTAEPVSAEVRDRILTAGQVAPTACNRQPQRILVVESAEGRAKAARAANIFAAPLLFIICAEPADAWQREYDGMNSYQIDVSIVTDHMMLATADEGLGSVWICHFKPEILRQEFSLPETLIPVNLLAVGHPAKALPSPDRHCSTRKPLHDTVFFEKF